MPTIHDVVQALARRDGADAVIMLGSDGLPIDSVTTDGADAEALSALIPGIIQQCEQFGRDASRGTLATGVLEYAAGAVIIANLTAEAKLLVLMRPRVNLGPLLYDLKRHRAEIAGLL